MEAKASRWGKVGGLKSLFLAKLLSAWLPAMMLAELIVLNGILGLLAGESFARDGLVAAAGVHFWADVVWHVIFGAL